MEMTTGDTFLSVQNLSKHFGALTALTGISFDLAPGKVLGVVGQRGSGKSTLIKLLSGVYPPTGGEMYLGSRRIVFTSALQAFRQGIDLVPQVPQLADNLNVLQNVFLGREICAPGWLKFWPQDKVMARVAQEILDDFDVPLELLYKYPLTLTDEFRQIVALARAMVQPSNMLLLDDSLASLSFERQQIMLKRIKKLAEQGVVVVISGDDLKHILAVTDNILVLYQGKQLAYRKTSETDPREIVELIVGTTRQEKITPVIWAFENYHAAKKQAEDLRRAQASLRKSLEAQDSLNRQLIERMHNQVEALDRLNIALQDANRRLITEREAERKALARDLHDQVMQDLLSYIYQLEETENEIKDKDQRNELSEIRGGIRDVVSSLRQLCSDLRPPTIDSHGLTAAIRSLTHQWSKQTEIPVELSIDPDLGRLPETIELSVFRIIQEGLSNVRKHANATHVKLSLQRSPTASLIVQLTDNGRGIKKPINLAELSEEKHFGLIGISERISLLRGTMTVNKLSAGGLELMIEIPSPYPSREALN